MAGRLGAIRSKECLDKTSMKCNEMDKLTFERCVKGAEKRRKLGTSKDESPVGSCR